MPTSTPHFLTQRHEIKACETGGLTPGSSVQGQSPGSNTHWLPGGGGRSGQGSRRRSPSQGKPADAAGWAAAGPGSSSPGPPAGPHSAGSAHGSSARPAPGGEAHIRGGDRFPFCCGVGEQATPGVKEPSEARKASGPQQPCPSRGGAAFPRLLSPEQLLLTVLGSPLCQDLPGPAAPFPPAQRAALGSLPAAPRPGLSRADSAGLASLRSRGLD